MKKIFIRIAFLTCILSVTSGKNCDALIYGAHDSLRDTIYIYETLTVYDTIMLHDTVRIKRAAKIPPMQAVNIYSLRFNTPPTNNNIYLLSSYTPSPNNNIEPVSYNEKNISFSTATFSENSIIEEKNNNISKKNNNNYKSNNDMNNIILDIGKYIDAIMNFNMANYVSGVLLTAQTMAGLSAQPSDSIATSPELSFTPFQATIIYPMTTLGEQTVNYRCNFSLNLVYGRVGAIDGIEVGAIVNHVDNEVRGMQYAGIANFANDVTGIQAAGIGNIADDVFGAQFADFINVSRTLTGAQFGGIINVTESATQAAQFGGIINMSKQFQGGQFAGIINANENFEGLQIAGILNANETCQGAQYAGIGSINNEFTGFGASGIFNRTKTLNGVQIAGIINVIDTIESGVSIALLNIVKNGYKEWTISAADYQNIGLSFKIGTQKLYTIFNLGATFMEDNLWIAGIGLGTRKSLGRRFDFQPEIMFYNYFPLNFKSVNDLTSRHLKLGFVYKLNERFGISVAPSIYYMNANLPQNYKVSSIPPFVEFERTHKGSVKNKWVDADWNYKLRHTFGAGITVGILFNN